MIIIVILILTNKDKYIKTKLDYRIFFNLQKKIQNLQNVWLVIKYRLVIYNSNYSIM